MTSVAQISQINANKLSSGLFMLIIVLILGHAVVDLNV